MGNITAQVMRTWEQRILSRREWDMLGDRGTFEYFNGTGASSQTQRLAYHSDLIKKVYELYDGTDQFTPMDGRVLKEVSALSGEARGFTFTEGNLLTFGDATDGYKPADSSSNKPGYLVVYRIAKDYTTSTTLTWTTQTIADNVSDDGDTAVFVDGADSVSILFDTDGADTGSPTFDLDVIGSMDGTTYQDAAAPLVTAFTAQAKDVEDATHVNVGAMMYIKCLLDVNTANLASTEYVTATVKVNWRY